MLYYELQALLQHNYNLAVAYLALVAMKVVFDEVFFQIRNCNMLYYELQALLQHNCNLSVAYLSLVATRYYTITTGCNKVTTRLQTNYY